MQTEKYYSGKQTEFQKIGRSPLGLEQFHSPLQFTQARLKGNAVVRGGPVTGPSLTLRFPVTVSLP